MGCRYKLITAGVLRDDGVSIPEAPGNRDWEEFLEWCAAGGVAGAPDYVAPAKVQEVTMRQARLQLYEMGLLEAVSSGIASAGVVAGIEWEYAATINRDNPTARAAGQMLGWDDAAIDAFFEAAALL